jgi:hypothetical protein
MSRWSLRRQFRGKETHRASELAHFNMLHISVGCVSSGTRPAKARANLLGGGEMSQALATMQTESPVINRERQLRILSKSLYRDLRQNGYEPKQIVALASELIAQVTTDIEDESTLA